MNPLLSIPTDNLYKFLFITGLTIIFSSVILFITLYQKINDRISDTGIELAKIKTESTFINEDLKRLQSTNYKIDSTDSIKSFEIVKQKIYKNKDYQDYLSFIFQHKEDLMPFYSEITLNNTLSQQINSKNRENLLKESRIKV